MSIPAIFTIIINLTSIFTKWTFYVDINGHYTYGSFAFIQTFCCYFYLVITIFNCINKAIKTKIKEERKEYMLYTTYIIFVIISRIFEDCFSMIPILYLSIFLIIQLLFLTIQNKNIFFDSLTGLNNRRKLNSYLAGKLKSVSDAHPIGIFMLDINNFKIINDNYGHLEGDKALQVVAEIISDFSTSNNAFTARYGGDEFCIILDCDFINYERTIKNLQNLFKNINLSKDETISLSIGGYFCSNNKVNAKEVLDYADKELYTNKKEWHKFN